MKILNIGIDKSALDKGSALADRLIRYGEMVEEYVIVVPASYDSSVELSTKVSAFSVGAPNKVLVLWPLYKKVCLLIDKHKVDLISVQDHYYLALVAWFIARKKKIALEIQVHSFEKYSWLRKMISRFVIKKADNIRTVSQRFKKRIMSDYGIGEDKISVVPIYTKTTGPRKEAKSSNGKFVYLFVGRLVLVKNVAMLIEAFLQIAKERGDVELWMVGDGPLRNDLEAMSDSKAIKFFGWADDVHDFYRRSDALVLPSDDEAWGLVVVEAMVAGLPVIMTDVGCAGEVLINDESGLVVPVGDKDALFRAMKKIIDNNLRNKLIVGGLEAVAKLPTLDDNLKKYRAGWCSAIKNYETHSKKKSVN